MYTRNIVWSKSQINIESRQEILSNSDIANTSDTPITFHILVNIMTNYKWCPWMKMYDYSYKHNIP